MRTISNFSQKTKRNEIQELIYKLHTKKIPIAYIREWLEISSERFAKLVIGEELGTPVEIKLLHELRELYENKKKDL
jgi:hypothetical protein